MLAMTMNVLIDKNSIFYYNSNTYSHEECLLCRGGFLSAQNILFYLQRRGV
jgi:hypothetical protein